MKSIDLERSGSRDSCTVRIVSGMQTAATSASIQNRPCQPVLLTSRPPTRGPAAAPAAEAAPQVVIARIWPAPEALTDSRLIPHARIVDPAAPWTHRPATTPPPLPARAMNTHEITNSPSPAMNTRRRPKTSPSAPDVTIVAAPTSM